MKLGRHLSRLLIGLVIALAGVLLAAAPAQATVVHTTDDGTIYFCRRVYFDDDGMTWSRFCYRHNGEEFNFHVFYDETSALVPTGEDFYVTLGYKALSVELEEALVITDDSPGGEFIATNSDGSLVYRVPAGSGDVTLETRGEMQGTFDPTGYFYPDDESLPRAVAVDIWHDEAFSGFADFMPVEDDPNWVGYPIHVKSENGDILYMWEGSWASFSFGVKDGYDINNFAIYGDIDVDWGGGVAINIRANDTGVIQIGTTNTGIDHAGTNGFITAPMSQDASIMLKGLTFNMVEPDYQTTAEINNLAADIFISASPSGSWSARVYDPTLVTFFGSSTVNFASIYANEPYASFPLTAYVLSAGPMGSDAHLALVDKTTNDARLVNGVTEVERNGLAYVCFDTTIGELLNSYVVPFISASAIVHRPGWAQTPSGAYVYYNDDGTLRTNDWASYGNYTFYMGEDGFIVSDRFIMVGDGLYYVDTTGIRVSNAGKSYGGNYYYFGPDGKAYRSSWVGSGSTWYFFDPDGHMFYGGWKYVAGVPYYFYSNGKLALSAWVVGQDGQYCYVGANGAKVTKGWASYNGKWYYMDEEGHVTINNFVQYNGKWYYMGKNGQPIVNDWVPYGDKLYYFGPSGYCVSVV